MFIDITLERVTPFAKANNQLVHVWVTQSKKLSGDFTDKY